MTTPENAISYLTSRDSPTARRISHILTDLVEWIDDTYPPEQITYRRQRCRARVVNVRIPGEGMARHDVGIKVHGAHMACDATRAHEASSPSLVLFQVETNTFWGTTAMYGEVGTTVEGMVCATTGLKRLICAKDESDGLDFSSEAAWNRTFDTPDALAAHLETLCDLSVGALSMRHAAEVLVGQPAGISGCKYLDMLVD